ncbi:unnamed protein product [Brachionus calyciflorus]|uniref:Uncharacterized protein n=1 Tax=Brachionus calyciflorus TaxID=104777 RepID=A0A814IFG9_9BILA|nr:unnamed protein product [Brachionus calyciflorus]
MKITFLTFILIFAALGTVLSVVPRRAVYPVSIGHRKMISINPKSMMGKKYPINQQRKKPRKNNLKSYKNKVRHY